MSEEKHNSQTHWIFSLIGVAIVFALLIVVNFIVNRAAPVKLDLTEDKLHTLSDGTKEILRGLDTPVKLSFFVTRDKDNMLPELATFAKKVDALLSEYAGVAKGDLLEIERVDPTPDSEEEDRARLNGLQSVPGRLGEPAYLGLSATCLDRKASIPIILPRSEERLEYEITRAILEVTRESPAKIGVMSALPVAGSGMPAMPFGGQQGQQPPWAFFSALQRDFPAADGGDGSNVVTVEMDVEKIPDDIDVLLLVHPGGISEATQFAIDQFVLRGGRLVAFLDPMSVIAQSQRPPQQPFGGQPPPSGPPTSSDLDQLLPAWGVTFESTQVLADRGFEIEQRRGEANPTVIGISAEGINEDDSLTGSMRDLVMLMPGVFYLDPKDGIKTETLVNSSEKSQLVSPAEAQAQPNRIASTFEASGTQYPLVVRLTGAFKTAFPGGAPGADDEEAEDEGDAEGEDEPEEEWLKESKEETTVLLVADSDMLFDQFSVQRDFFGIRPVNHNVPLVQGAVEQAAGGANLISIRSRGSTRRPFNTFKKMREEASEELTKEITKVEEKEQELAGEIQKLMTEQGSNQMVVLSPEASQKIEELRAQQVEASQRRRELSRELRKDIRKIENRIKLANIAIVPILVLLAGIAHLVIRRSRIGAR